MEIESLLGEPKIDPLKIIYRRHTDGAAQSARTNSIRLQRINSLVDLVDLYGRENGFTSQRRWRGCCGRADTAAAAAAVAVDVVTMPVVHRQNNRRKGNRLV